MFVSIAYNKIIIVIIDNMEISIIPRNHKLISVITIDQDQNIEVFDKNSCKCKKDVTTLVRMMTQLVSTQINVVHHDDMELLFIDY